MDVFVPGPLLNVTMDETQNLKKEVALHYKIFAVLLVLVVINVTISNLKLGVALAIFLILCVTMAKASLVASFFLHLNREKKIVYVVLILTAVTFIVMIALFTVGFYNVPAGTKHLNFDYKTGQKHGTHHDGGQPKEGHENQPAAEEAHH